MIRLSTETQSRRSLDEKIIPMINVIFLLLIFFMVAGNLSRLVSRDIALPGSVSDQMSEAAEISLLLTDTGELYWQGQQIEIHQLREILGRADKNLPIKLELNADARVKAAHLVPLINEMTKQGVSRVSLVTMNRPKNI